MYLFSYGIEVITKILARFLTILMWLIVITVVWQVFTRFLTDSPSTFTDELSRYLMIWIGVLGGAYTFGLKRHLAIELLITKVKQKEMLAIFINLMVMLFSSIVFIYGGLNVSSRALEFNQISPSISLFGSSLKMGYVYLVAPLSGFIINLYAVYDITKLTRTIVNNKKADG